MGTFRVYEAGASILQRERRSFIDTFRVCLHDASISHRVRSL